MQAFVRMQMQTEWTLAGFESASSKVYTATEHVTCALHLTLSIQTACSPVVGTYLKLIIFCCVQYASKIS